MRDNGKEWHSASSQREEEKKRAESKKETFREKWMKLSFLLDGSSRLEMKTCTIQQEVGRAGYLDQHRYGRQENGR